MQMKIEPMFSRLGLAFIILTFTQPVNLSGCKVSKDSERIFEGKMQYWDLPSGLHIEYVPAVKRFYIINPDSIFTWRSRRQPGYRKPGRDTDVVV